MRVTIKAYGRFWLECARRSISLSWGTANNLGGAVIVVLCGLTASHYWPSLILNPVISTVLYILIAWAVLLFLWAVFIAPFDIYREQQEQICELGKVDADDLERMLGGHFIGSTFLLGGDVNPMKTYTGEAEIRHLNARLAKVSVRAPKHSQAGIYFQFMNGHPSPDKKCRFYYLDPNGKDVLIENIYAEQQIMLDADSCFEFKLSIDDGYELNEHSSVWILLRHWTK